MKDRLCRSPEITFWCRGICVNFVSECHSFCHCAAFSKMKNVYSLFQSIYTLLSSFFLKHSKERYRCTSNWRVWAISLVHFLFSRNLWSCELKVWWENTMSMSYFGNLLMWYLKGVAMDVICLNGEFFDTVVMISNKIYDTQ